MALTTAQEAYLAKIADVGLAQEAYEAKLAELNAARQAVTASLNAARIAALDSAQADVAAAKTAGERNVAMKQREVVLAVENQKIDDAQAADPEVIRLTNELQALKP